ncbi:MAG TPA: hypothetical protein VFO44_04995, partial [Steroidobacteraceae bacterium]|nr:hypothetical protein [Steroidobacteraceae bacterium]
MSACRAASGADPAIPRAPYRVLSCLCALLLAAAAQSAACAQPGRAAKPEAAARNATPAQLKPFTIEDLVRL